MRKLLLFLLLSYLTITSYALDNIAKGSRVSILEIANGDTYYEERADFLGKDATALGVLSKNSNGFYSGTLEVDGGRTCFFKNVRVSLVQAPEKHLANPNSLFKNTIPKGTSFVILEVAVDDSYYSDRKSIVGKTGVAKEDMDIDSEGYTSGSVNTSDGSSYYFYKVKLGKNDNSSSSSSSSYSSYNKPSTTKSINFITGKIYKGTAVYVADISPDDSYYSNRATLIGKKGKVSDDMLMKEDGYYAGSFKYDDGTTGYFYKAKFSKTPVDKITSTNDDNVSNNDDDEYGWADILSDDDEDAKEDPSWKSAKNDYDIYAGDKVKVVAVSSNDSYYSDRDDYIGKTGVAGDDIEYDADKDAYGGKVILDNGEKPYFYLVKLVKLNKSSSSSSTTYKSSIAKNTKVKVIALDSDDSFYTDRSKYVGKSGKVAEGLTHQGDGFYSGKIIFNDGTNAYFYKVKFSIIK